MGQPDLAGLLMEFEQKTGLKAKEVAVLADIPERTYTNIVNGRTRNPNPRTLRKIAKLLRVDVKALRPGRAEEPSGRQPCPPGTDANGERELVTGIASALAEETVRLAEAFRALEDALKISVPAERRTQLVRLWHGVVGDKPLPRSERKVQ